MAADEKTPAAYLQELCVQRKITPEYSLINNTGDVHKPTFTMQVTVGEHVVTGSGFNKKEAKHMTALNMLYVLKDDKEFNVDKITKFLDCREKKTLSQAPKPTNVVEKNAIGMLDDLCLCCNAPYPKYEVIREEGPPHLKYFTMECTIFNESKSCVANTKKQAKQLVASEMHTCLTDLTEFEMKTRNLPRDNCSEYIEMSRTFPILKTNFMLEVTKLTRCLEVNNLNLCDNLLRLIQQYKEPDFLLSEKKPFKLLKVILTELNWNYAIKQMNLKDNSKYAVVIVVEFNPEIACVGYGSTYNRALYAASKNTIRTVCSLCVNYDGT